MKTTSKILLGDPLTGFSRMSFHQIFLLDAYSSQAAGGIAVNVCYVFIYIF